ncbi:MAG: hypothetical protein OIF32_02140, partial [Campylobacterales bacterium]|nr:hypothetical protein [Campylobacterales bacterium]
IISGLLSLGLFYHSMFLYPWEKVINYFFAFSQEIKNYRKKLPLLAISEHFFGYNKRFYIKSKSIFK